MILFKPFGHTKLVYIPLQNRTKLDVTAKPGTTVGLSESDMCYMIHCHTTEIIVQARDVTYIDDDDEQLYVDEERYEVKEKPVGLSSLKNRGTINASSEQHRGVMKTKLKRTDQQSSKPDQISRRKTGKVCREPDDSEAPYSFLVMKIIALIFSIERSKEKSEDP